MMFNDSDNFDEEDDLNQYGNEEDWEEYCPTCGSQIDSDNHLIDDTTCQRCDRGWPGALLAKLLFFEGFPEKWWK